ncbi:MAG: hypothetical protein KZQ94_16410 [Candidatus Thiodiazotropha sp. (ex Troendleina suluensis)]|nr:hypothetical protein [Candidatus Thiodiazotropha sp.]MCU7840949.1 hypothetical protein [Candidatus Thiodiazotropha sp. (ex Troendleina suluensis)]MCU7872733.1 hypothetical protein [Candidatus Thiodiazotropha sp. (ex Lucinoma borealis)]
MYRVIDSVTFKAAKIRQLKTRPGKKMEHNDMPNLKAAPVYPTMHAMVEKYEAICDPFTLIAV